MGVQQLWINKIILMAVVGFLLAIEATADVWHHDGGVEWNEQWEDRYSHWVESDLETTWLQDPKQMFYQWPVDCSKFVYLSRLYFSYQNGLEFAVLVPSGKAFKVVSSRSAQWDRWSTKEERVRGFASYILRHVNTSTLQANSVLVPVNKYYIKPGVIVSGDAKRAHVWLLKSVSPTGNAKMIFATLPASEFLYESLTFPPPESAFPRGLAPSVSYGGLRRFKWPQHLLATAERIPYFSREQTHVDYHSFFDHVQKSLQVKPMSRDEEFRFLLEDACMKVRVRTNIIIDAAAELSQLRGAAMSSQERDLFSTEKRDKDILLMWERIDRTFNDYESELSSESRFNYASIKAPRWVKDDFCWVQWAENRIEPLGFIRKKFLTNKVSSRAEDPFAERWGESVR